MKKVFLLFITFFILMVFSCASKPKANDSVPEFTFDEELSDTEDTGAELAEETEEIIEEEPPELVEVIDEPIEEAPVVQEINEEPENVPEIVQEPVEQEPVIEQEPEVVVQAPVEPVRQPPLPPPALLGPAEERSPVTRPANTPRPPAVSLPPTTPGQSSDNKNQDTAVRPSDTARPPLDNGQRTAQGTTPSAAESTDTSADESSPASTPTVFFAKDDPPIPARSNALIPQSDEIVFSRTVRATVGQIVEIPFRGTGWVYLGELASRRGIIYNSRRLDPEGQSFIFKTEEAGTYALKFFRQDFIRDYILNDHVQVIVGEAPQTNGAGWFNPPVDRGRVVALPRWPSPLDEAAIQRGGSGVRPSDAQVSAPNGASQARGSQQGGTRDGTPQNGNVPQANGSPEPLAYVEPAAGRAPRETAAQPPVQGDVAPAQSSQQGGNVSPQTTGALPAQLPAESETDSEKLPLEDALKKAKETFDEGNVAAAIAMLDRYREYYPSGSDELYWLLGQFYEANTPSRDILLSLDYYRRLMNEYPQSNRYNDARRRIAYLERFYINIQ